VIARETIASSPAKMPATNSSTPGERRVRATAGEIREGGLIPVMTEVVNSPPPSSGTHGGRCKLSDIPLKYILSTHRVNRASDTLKK
jgi:hypothetical protein